VGGRTARWPASTPANGSFVAQAEQPRAAGDHARAEGSGILRWGGELGRDVDRLDLVMVAAGGRWRARPSDACHAAPSLPAAGLSSVRRSPQRCGHRADATLARSVHTPLGLPAELAWDDPP
jgi:hypothetical protein